MNAVVSAPRQSEGFAPSTDRASETAWVFFFATALLALYDIACSLRHLDETRDMLAALLSCAPRLLFALPAGVGLAAWIVARLTGFVVGEGKPSSRRMLVAMLLPAAPAMLLVSRLFTGAGIAGSAWRWPLLLAALAATWGATVISARVAVLIRTRIARPDRGGRLPLLVVSTATGLLVAGLHGVTVRVLPGLYPAFHLLVAGAAVGVLAVGLWGVLPVLPRLPRTRRVPLVLAAILAVTWPAGVAISYFRPAGDQLLADHAPFTPEVLGPLGAAEYRLMRKLTDAIPSPASHRDPMLWTARFDEDAKRRSVLLLTVDSLRWDVLDPTRDLGRHTPGLQRLADSGLRYRRAYSPANHTVTAVPALLLGRFASHPHSSINRNDFISSAFSRVGHRTFCVFAGGRLPIAESRLGFLQSRGFFFEDFEILHGGVEEVLPIVGGLMARSPAPFFGWAHLIDTHTVFRGSLGRATYDTRLARLDRHLTPFIEDWLEREPELVVVLTSDHGEALGDRGARGHGGNLHEEQIRVPLFIVGSGIPADEITSPVSLLDLPTTLLTASGAGLDPRATVLPGFPSIENAPRESIVSEGSGGCAIIEWPWKLMANPNSGSMRLFDLSWDPGETRNLAPSHSERTQSMLRRMTTEGCPLDMGRFHRPPRPTENPAIPP